ncbi:MAG: methyltransferase domain-containing protein [Micropruina sp.]|uniref:class I SAM-dependent methyltransferase n=1 Tax=Micropruina sp. TaxID=2737536 RepID=UPI0039E7160A
MDHTDTSTPTDQDAGLPSRRAREARGMTDYWDARSVDYDATHEVADRDTWKEVLEGLVGSDRTLRILDVATGTGLIANLLAEHGYTKVTGTDLSEGMMRFAREHAAAQGLDVDYRFGNALDLPLPDASFDVVINSRLLWTLTEADPAIREWARVLAPGGTLIAINELEPGEGIRTGPLADYRTKIQAGELPLANADIDEILAALTGAGLRDVRLRHLPGCHLVKRDRENWYAFTATKGAENR